MSPLSLAALVAAFLATPAQPHKPDAKPEAETYTIRGVVRHPHGGASIPDALVIVQCACLQAMRETQTDRYGRYRFTGLPAGNYLVQVLAGSADVSRYVQLPRR